MEVSKTCPRHYYDNSNTEFPLATVFPASGKVSPGSSFVEITIINSSTYLETFLPSVVNTSVSTNTFDIDSFTSYSTIVVNFYTTHDITLTGNENALDIKIDSTTIIHILNSSGDSSTIYKANRMYQWKIYIAKKSTDTYAFVNRDNNSNFANISGVPVDVTITSAVAEDKLTLKIANASGKSFLNKFRFVNIELYTTDIITEKDYLNCWPGCISCNSSNDNLCLDSSRSQITNGVDQNLEYFNFAAITPVTQVTMVEVEVDPPIKANGYTLGFWVFYSKAKSTISTIADYFVNIEADDIIQAKISQFDSPLKLKIEPRVLGVTYQSEAKSDSNWLDQWVHVKIGYLENRKYTHADMLDSFIAINHKDGDEVKSEFSTKFFLKHTTDSNKIEKPFSRIWDNAESFTLRITRDVSTNTDNQLEIYIREVAVFDTYIRTPFQNL